MREKNPTFKETVKIVFGSNLSGVFKMDFNLLKPFYICCRGLISAREFGDVFQDLRKSIFITSSIYYVSKEVRS